MHTIWAFQLVVDIAPPAPILGATFDDSMLWDKRLRDQLDVRLPLSRRILKSVTLLSVD